MQKTFKRTISILLSILMIVGVFTIVPLSASAATITCPNCGSTNIRTFGMSGYRCMDCNHVFANIIVADTHTITFASSLVNHTDVAAVELSSDYFDEDCNAQADTAYPYTSSSSFGGMQRIEFDVAINSQDFEPGAVTFTAGETTLSMYDADNRIGDDNAAVSYNTIGIENNDSFYGYHYTVNTTDITDDITVSYSPTPKYTVTWQDWDDTPLKTEVLAEGTTPTYTGTTPEKAEDEQNTYTFSGWRDGNTTYGLSDTLPAVSGDVTYTAQYTATFKGITSNELYEGLVLDEGTALKFMLMKSGERWQNGYLQVYLDDVLVKDLTVEGGPTTEPDRYYTTTKKCIVDSYEKYSNAHFIHFKSVYDVTWKNDDGTVLEKDENVVVGTTPTYDGEAPTKAEDEKYTYTFAGWNDGTTTYGLSDTLPNVTADVTYTATFDATFKGILSGDLRKGLVIDAGTPIRFAMTKTEDSWSILGLQVYLDDVLVKSVQTEQLQPTEPDRYYTTTKKCIVDSYSGSGNSYPRVYHTLRLKSLYTVTWKNEDGTTLETDVDVVAGKTPTYNGTTPTKDGVTFAGWTDSHGVFYAKDATLPEVTADETYTAVFELTIGSVDEWNSFAASVKGGNTYSGIIVRMTADVGPVTTMVDGTFSGTFDGDGHTLTVNISGGSTSAATFAYVKDATIQNLRLEGTVTSSGNHTAALVKAVSDTGSTCTIKNVDIYADVNCSNNYIGGFIGHAGTANTVNIENSIFAGSINKTGATQGNFIGAFIGWSQTLTATINNCAFTGNYNNIKSFNNIGFSYNAPTKVTVSGFYSNASEVFVANVNHGTRLYVPSSSYPTTVALVKNNDGETLYSAFSDALAAWTDGSTLALLADVTCDSMISVPANTSKILDLNGNALSLSYSSTKVEVNGTLTIQSTASGGSITPTTKSRVINVVDGGTLNIESGTINGYNADRAVIGGVGTINLNGGKIVTPASNAFSPDGVATLNLNGGEIECTSGSTSMGTASAVWAHGDSTINWNGTAITTNTGDGIRMKSAGNGTVNVTGGSFTATSSSLPEEGGYAVYVNSNMSSLNLKGNPSFSGRGIYLTNDKVINITDELSNTNPISVTMQTPGVFTSGLSGNGDASNFANGNGTGYALTLNASGEAQIVSTHTITWKLDANTEIDTTEVVDGVVPTHAAPSKAADNYYTYTFAGWNDGETTYAPNELPAATADVTYTAQFTSEARTFMVFVKKLTGGTINVYDVSGETTVAQLKDILVSQTGVPASAQRLIFAGKQLENDKQLSEYNIQKESTIHLVIESYTVTWLNYDNSELGTTTVQYGATPTYDGEAPTKAADDSKQYTFAGWNDGQTTYAPNEALPQVSGNVTYTAQFTGTDHAWDTANAVWDAEPVFYSDPDNYGEDAYKANVTVTCTDCQKTKTFTASTSGRFFAIEEVSSDCEEGTGSYTKVTVYATIGGEDISHEYHVNEGPVEHEFVSHVAAKEATYEADGNIEYWQCAVCRKCFSDEDCTNEIAQEDTVIPKLKKLFTGHTITLGGDIGVNFYLNPAVLDTYTGTKTVKFTVDGKETTVAVPATAEANGYYMVTCNVVAAQMAHQISAVVYADDTALDQTDSYSVQDYAEAVYAEPVRYLPADDADKAPALKALAAALLHYGGEAQTVFDSALYSHPDRADSNLDEAADYTGVDAAAVTAKINGEASDLDAVAADLNAKYFTNSLIYLQNNTLRVYFTPTTYPADMPNAGAYDGNLSNYYYYKDKANIAAAELDDQQTFTVGNVSFKYSPLNYVVNVLNSSNMSPEQQNLAKSLFLYNQAANAFFDAAPAPVENEVISSGFIDDFSTLNVGDYIAKGVEYAADDDYKVVLTGGTYGTESRDGIVVRNGDYNFNAGEYGMGTYSYHVPQPNVFIEDYNENEKFYPAVDGVEGNAFVVVAKDDTQKIITIAGANVIQN